MTSIFRRQGRSGWTLKYRDADGNWKMEQLATRAAAEERALVLRQAPQTSRTVLFRDYVKTWLFRVRQHLRSGTAEVYSSLARAHLLPAFGHLPLRDLTRARVKDFLAEKLEAGFSRNYVRNLRATLHSCLEQAREDGLLYINPADRGRAMRLEKAARGKVKAFDVDQLQRFLSSCLKTEPRWWMLFRLMSLTGLRLGEALGLQWTDVDLPARVLYVRRGWTRHTIEPTKTGHERTVDLAAPLALELARLDAQRKAAGLAAGEMVPWLFPSSSPRSPAGNDVAQAAFKRALKAAELPQHHTPHSLRHTFASILISKGRPIAYVQRALGHQTITMTVDTYGSWLPAGDHAVVDGLAELVTTDVTTSTKSAEPAAKKSRRIPH